MDKNEVKKDLYKSKNMAKFSHYVSGNLYYKVELADGIYQFPIPTVEEGPVACRESGDGTITTVEPETIVRNTVLLSNDLGTTTFGNEIRGSELSRWINKAIDSGDFVKIG